MHTHLIDARTLAETRQPDWVILDCRFKLDDPEYGLQAYEAGRIPGAHYLNLDYHLSGTCNGQNGRHPLPDAQRLAVDLGAMGIGTDTQVVAYDDSGGMFAARAWWLLRWLGHAPVAVLDGGYGAWLEAGYPVSTERAPRRSTRFSIRAPLVDTVRAEDILDALGSTRLTVVDARSPDRFRGENETLDPVGGHIPGARNRFFRDNLDAQGRFKAPEVLRQEWLALLGERSDANGVVHQCGSGVTACVNQLALELAGLQGSVLYPGSWSEWCADPARPVATGDA
ncbi:sulfurtransferase [Gulbenkiania mobilis]|uniref:Thiosulfate/3-mercaptopyruvate sulfurtransferase n=1 Tax=Gulbenkiania mobilis TaxID=397457 RepID=A0ABY2CYL0_GULMO|nr:thiosulfate/3-mercaptopyruvate sulfurtransferase [Gulbenkiania mobilis]